ncbi:MAG: hypothetical protein L6Q92_10355 [Phycisphaerae bacterium]|nr:hypothetical protein [Phycisphaerae bacterium]
MSAADLDLFDVWRWMLALLCTTYAVVVTLRTAWDWIVFLSGTGRDRVLIRNYALVLLLRMRWRPFAWELAGIAVWSVVLGVLLWAHVRIL